MNLQEYILNEIHELSTSSSLKAAQELFSGFPITHIPIVENGHLLGCISESDAQTIEDNSAAISEYSHLKLQIIESPNLQCSKFHIFKSSNF